MVKQVRAARTRQALVLAAAEAFAHDGYAGASLPAISRRAGVSAGALHFHFPSKDALAGEIESVAARRVEELAERCRSSDGSALGVLVAAIRHLVVAFATDPVVRAGFALGGDLSRDGGATVLDRWHGWVREVVGQAQRTGELADGVSPDGVAVAVVAATVGFEALGSRDRDWLSKERVVEFWACLLPRLSAVPGHDPADVPEGGAVGDRDAGSSLAGL
ncbi:ScbR family autoregulator-binding transcription factor [Streptomyces cellostaticus]|uniref:ScbR family autoregulator-binding transcription factor n=1 Tax=Streptomyces cellostaticus TaxID=67285 RepID=UPI0008333419|nr:ScbR family autoregulator-binding transcription factor [Streptomyces cellostaticus]GHI01973.1 TetR family transcriptional regulator [Streptomyces cellostaticus]